MRATELLEDQYEPVAIRGDKSIEKIVKYMRLHCQPWINTVGLDKVVYRGTNTNDNAFVRAVRDDRKPRDSSDLIHNLYNSLIKMAGGIANRTNSVFVSSSMFTANIYGTPRIAIPAGEFDYTWSPLWSDWFSDLTDSKEILGKLMAPTERKELRKLYIATVDDMNFATTQQYAEELLNNYISDLGNYSLPAVKATIKANTNLPEAIASGHEIMVKCPAVLYLDPALYTMTIVPKYLEQQNEQNA